MSDRIADYPELVQRINILISICKQKVSAIGLPQKDIFSEKYIRKDIENIEIDILFPTGKNCRERYGYLTRLVESDNLLDPNPAKPSKKSVSFESKLNKRVKELEELEKFLVYIDEVVKTSQSRDYLIIHFTEKGFKYGFLTIGDDLESAELTIFGKRFPDHDSRQQVFRTPIQVSQNEAKDKDQVYSRGGIYFELIEVETTDSQTKQTVFVCIQRDALGSREQSEILTASYATLTNTTSLPPTAGLMFLLKTSESRQNVESKLRDRASSPIDDLTASQFNFIKYYLGGKIVVGKYFPSSFDNISTRPEYINFKNLSERRGLYVGYCIKTWSGNYKTLEQFLLRINESGKVTMYTLDINHNERYGYIYSANTGKTKESNFFIKISDTEYEYQNPRFTLTLIPDPTTINLGSSFLFGVMSGVERSLSPSSGRLALVKISDNVVDKKSFIDFQESDHFEPFSPTNYGTAGGIKNKLRSKFEEILNSIIKLNNYTGKKKDDILSKKSWLENFFSPDNPYDLTETTILKSNWNSRPVLNTAQQFGTFEIYLLSETFHKPVKSIQSDDNLSRFKILCYPAYLDSSGIMTIVVTNLTMVSGSASITHDQVLTFSCFDQAQHGMIVQGTLKDFSLLTYLERPTANRPHAEGILTIFSPTMNNYLRSSKMVVFKNEVKYENFEEWKKDALGRKSYAMNKYSDILELEKIKSGLVQSLSGQINRLIQVPKSDPGNQFLPRLQENVLVYFHAALYAAKYLSQDETYNYLVHAALHSFPVNREQAKWLIEETDLESGRLSKFRTAVEVIWLSERMNAWRLGEFDF